ncbi:MAG: ABC transporter substrate-binding protein [Betaproteobacteria bacterium]|nr:MAG: ABC transporter substrate-binding protein [Betaproteobacteria bacterium]
MNGECNRRQFLKGASALGAASLFGVGDVAYADPPAEVKRIRLAKSSLCIAPQYVAEPLFRMEGFSEVQYLHDDPREIGTSKLVAEGKADIQLSFGLTTLLRVEAGEPVVMLGGVHVGCYELFGSERIHSIRELRGRRVAVPGLGSSHHLFLSIIASYVGLDPQRDISWVTSTPEQCMQWLAEGRVDAYLGFPPDPQALRAAGVGNVLLNSSTDKPWSQYLCCMVNANRTFIQRYPVATKRALRALLKATDLCATEPERSAQFMFDRGFAQNYEYALQALKDVQYTSWRSYSAEDSVRFFALRLHDVAMVRSTPDALIANGTDWRFLDELKKELKA